jgi:hypothetical protein
MEPACVAARGRGWMNGGEHPNPRQGTLGPPPPHPVLTEAPPKDGSAGLRSATAMRARHGARSRRWSDLGPANHSFRAARVQNERSQGRGKERARALIPAKNTAIHHTHSSPIRGVATSHGVPTDRDGRAASERCDGQNGRRFHPLWSNWRCTPSLTLFKTVLDLWPRHFGAGGVC